MLAELKAHFTARTPVIWLVTQEEARAEMAITQALRELQPDKNKANVSCASWSLIGNNGMPGWCLPRGETELTCDYKPYGEGDDEHTAIISFVKWSIDKTKLKNKLQRNKLNIAIIRDANICLNNYQFIAAIKDASHSLLNTLGTIVCLSVSSKIPQELTANVAVLQPGPPREDILRAAVEKQLNNYQKRKEISAKKDDKDVGGVNIINGITNTKEDVVSAMKGLTLAEARSLLSLSFATKKTNIDIDFISAEKAKKLSTVPGLRLEKKIYTMDDIGGLDNLKTYLKKRKKVFTKEAKEFGLANPKGLLIFGIPGGGKSLCAKAAAAEYGLPLLSLNLNEVKGGIVGETEANIRTALARVDAAAPCCCWLDEIEKGVPQAGGKNLDGGASAGMMQALLKWMQERETDVYLIATANDVSAIPPELMRKGRFDETFFVDMPGSVEEIEQIINIHVRRRGRKLPARETTMLAHKLINNEGSYTGAEIEAAVNEGLITAFNESRELETKDIEDAILSSVPLYKTMREQIFALREWCKGRAVPASSSYKDRLKEVGDELDITQEDLQFELAGKN